MKKAILIGASGFLGSHLLETLRQSGIRTTVVLHRTKVEFLENTATIQGGIRALTCDIIDDFAPDVIFHCARPTSRFSGSMGRRIAAYKAHRLNKRLVQAIGKSKTKPKLVFASGSLVYGSHPNQIITENFSPDPISYAREYHKGETPIEAALKDRNTLILRFPWLLGSGSWFKWFYLKTMTQQKAVPLFGDGSNKMHFISVKNASSLMLAFGLSNAVGIQNIYSPDCLSQLEFARLLRAKSGFPIKPADEVLGRIKDTAISEAFRSNIRLGSVSPSLLDRFQFDGLDNELSKLIESELDHFENT